MEYRVTQSLFVLTNEQGQVVAVLKPVAEGRKPLARAVLSLPAVIRFLADRKVTKFTFSGKPMGLKQLSPIAWAFYGEIKAGDLAEARAEAFRIAQELGVQIPPKPAPQYEEVDLTSFTGGAAPSPAPASPDGGAFAD
ncbi:MAG: hypothetical protein QXN56_06980 [Candidatus Hadarchaeum sp.]